jgi:hypothetical protein
LTHHLHHQVINLHPAAERAILARGTLDVLGMHHVPVAIGTDGGDVTSPSLHLPDYAPTPVEPFPSGAVLLHNVLEAAEDSSLTLLLISSIKDASELLKSSEALFAKKVNRVAIMGGVEQQLHDGELLPDTAHNNEFDRASSQFFYKRLQQLGVPMVIVSRRVAYSCPVRRGFFGEMAASGSLIGAHLQSRQRQSIEELWCRAVGPERLGLPARCDKEWFKQTFCAGSEEVDKRGFDDSIWDLVECFNMYDTFALLACIPCLSTEMFQPARYTVLGVEHLAMGVSDEQTGLCAVEEAEVLLKAGYLVGVDPVTKSRNNVVCHFPWGSRVDEYTIKT